MDQLKTDTQWNTFFYSYFCVGVCNNETIISVSFSVDETHMHLLLVGFLSDTDSRLVNKIVA